VIDTTELREVRCQAVGCPRRALREVILLRLDPSQTGGLGVRVCQTHRLKLEQLGQLSTEAAVQRRREPVVAMLDQVEDADDDG
jgi:hypothetical protein